MSKLGAAFLTASILAATSPIASQVSATEVPHRIASEAAWGCRDKNDVIDLLFLGLSTSFDTKLASALADGRCVYFKSGENVTVIEDAEHGLVKIERSGATPVVYWTPLRNVN
jgi:hypothetical protein